MGTARDGPNSSNSLSHIAKGSARLRITVTASHEEDQIRSLCEAIKSETGCSHRPESG